MCFALVSFCAVDVDGGASVLAAREAPDAARTDPHARALSTLKSNDSEISCHYQIVFVKEEKLATLPCWLSSCGRQPMPQGMQKGAGPV